VNSEAFSSSPSGFSADINMRVFPVDGLRGIRAS